MRPSLIVEWIGLLLLCTMITPKILIPLTAFILLLSSCVVSKVNENAMTNYEEARQAIKEIKLRGIVFVFPTEYKKERVLRNISQSKPSVLEQIQKIKSQRKQRLALWQSQISEYKFSAVSIVPDSLLKSYIDNPNRITSLNTQGDKQEVKLNDIYVLYTEFGGFEVKQNGTFIANPFPNQAKPSKWASIRDFLGVQGDEKSINSFFTKLNSSFNRFYTLPTNQGTNP